MVDQHDITLEWEGRILRLSYKPRYLGMIDHVEVRSDDGAPLPITETGYRSHFFGPVEPVMTIEEVRQMVIDWLNSEAAKPEWQAHLADSQQLTLF